MRLNFSKIAKYNFKVTLKYKLALQVKVKLANPFCIETNVKNFNQPQIPCYISKPSVFEKEGEMYL